MKSERIRSLLYHIYGIKTPEQIQLDLLVQQQIEQVKEDIRKGCWDILKSDDIVCTQPLVPQYPLTWLEYTYVQ